MDRRIDEALAEIDMLALADAVGVVRGGPIERSAAERWSEPIPGHRPYDDRRTTRTRRMSRPYEDVHRAERDERIGHAGGFNGDPRTDPRKFIDWLVERLKADERKRRSA